MACLDWKEDQISWPDKAGLFLLASCFLWLASCGPEQPEPGAWHRGQRAEGAIVEVGLPYGAGPAATGLSMGSPIHDVDEQVLYFPVFIGLQRHVYRFEIPAMTGRWQDTMPPETPGRRRLFDDGRLLGDSSYLRQYGPRAAPQEQPFGTMAITLEQHETRYSRTFYQIGFPFGESGWVTRHYRDGRLELYAGNGLWNRTLLLSQDYKADNYSFTAGWSPDGRHVLVLEEITGASYHDQTRGQPPMLRFAIFGPYPVGKTKRQIVDYFARADEKAQRKRLDGKLARGLLSPEERYGRFYEDLVETIGSCPALEAITGPVDTLSLRPGRTLALSDGNGREVGKYFTFDLHTEHGSGVLMAAAFYTESAEETRRGVVEKIARYDLFFDGRNHYLEDCQAR